VLAEHLDERGGATSCGANDEEVRFWVTDSHMSTRITPATERDIPPPFDLFVRELVDSAYFEDRWLCAWRGIAEGPVFYPSDA
jgi:hypothetical protein